MLCNNLCESFNAYILEVRSKSIITMMESIKVSLMERIVNRRNKTRRELENSVVCP